MEMILAIALGSVAMLMGVIGCFLPVLPGVAIAYAALFVLFAFDCPPTATQLMVGAVVLAAVTLMDYILPSVCAKRFNCSRWGVFGCFVGSIVGLFFLPLGIIFGPFLGTVAGELIVGKDLVSSIRGGFGAFVGFVLCLGLKLVAVGLYAWWYFSCLPYSGTAGCNLRCRNCQNALISQSFPAQAPGGRLMPDDLTQLMRRTGLAAEGWKSDAAFETFRA